MTSTPKAKLRDKLIAQRQTLTTQEVADISSRTLRAVQQEIDWSKIKQLHTYVPIAFRHEIDTWPLLQFIWEYYPVLETFVPIVQDGRIRSARVTKDTAWQPGHLGIPQPIAYDLVPETRQFDVIVVPSLGFNERRHRIGYGKGHYDRFLATQFSAQTIGLCYDMGLCNFGPQAHDIALQKIITETTIFTE